MILFVSSFCWRSLVRGSRPAREDREQQDFRAGAFRLQLGDDRLHALGGLRGRALIDLIVVLLLRPALMSRVVRADHEHDLLRLEAVEVAVLQAPQDMLRAVAADAEVRGLQRRPILLPDRLAFALPAVRDGVAEEDELGLALLGDLVERLVAFLGARMQHRHDRVVFRSLGDFRDERRSGEEGEEEGELFHVRDGGIR